MNLTGQRGRISVGILSPNILLDFGIAHFTTEMLYRISHKLPDWWAHSLALKPSYSLLGRRRRYLALNSPGVSDLGNTQLIGCLQVEP